MSAEKIIKDLYDHHKKSNNRLDNLSKQIEDLKTATKIQHEKKAVGFNVGNNENGLNQFVKSDGGLRLLTNTEIIRTSNGDRPVQKAGLLDTKDPSCKWHEDLIRLTSERQIIRMAQHVPYTPKYDVKLQNHLSKAPGNLQNAITKVFADTAGVGAEWIPDQFLPDLFSLYEVPRGLRALFNEITVDKSTVLVPRLDAGGRPYLKGKLSQDDPLSKYTASSITTGQKSINLAGFATLYNIDDAAAEDSLIPALPTLSRQIAADLTDAFEDALINADTTASHGDTGLGEWNIRSRWGASGLGGTSDHRRAFMGLRHYALDIGASAKTDLSSALTYATFLAIRYKLGEIGTSNVVCIVSPEVYIKYIMGMDAVRTVDLYGPKASVVSGEVAQVGGVPIVVSRYLSADMHATGVYTGSGTTSGMLMVSTDAWNVYNRRGILVEQDKDIASGSIQLVSTMRASLATPAASSTVSVAYGYNLG